MTQPITPQAVSEFISQYDPAREHDAREVSALVQGMLAGLAMMENGPLRKMTTLVSVEQDKGSDGIYNPWFHLVFESGLRVRVSVEPEL